MGLREAVVEIVEQMEGDHETIEYGRAYDLVQSYIRQLHSVLKASEGEQTFHLGTIQKGTSIGPAIERKLKKETQREEEETNFKLCAGGKSDGVMIPTYPDTPVTARTWIEGEVYEFDGKEWKFNESVTEKMVKEIHSK